MKGYNSLQLWTDVLCCVTSAVGHSGVLFRLDGGLIGAYHGQQVSDVNGWVPLSHGAVLPGNAFLFGRLLACLPGESSLTDVLHLVWLHFSACH